MHRDGGDSKRTTEIEAKEGEQGTTKKHYENKSTKLYLQRIFIDRHGKKSEPEPYSSLSLSIRK